MVTYVMLGVIAVLAFLCVSDGLADFAGRGQRTTRK